MTTTGDIIEVHDLTVSYDKKPALWNVDFELPVGKLIGIIGPNGAGKSTLLKSIMGLLPAASGYVRIFGKHLDEVRDRVSYIPQRGSVDWDFPANVLEVVLMGLYKKTGLLKRSGKKEIQLAREALAKVGLLDYEKRHISKLSGGQQQRVFLARALAQDADLYLMDEPFAGVDATTESSIISLLGRMRDEGKTILVVHHDLNSAKAYFDHMILLNTRLVACGVTQDVFNKDNLQDAYGGTLSLLTDIGEFFRTQEIPLREG